VLLLAGFDGDNYWHGKIRPLLSNVYSLASQEEGAKTSAGFAEPDMANG